MIIRVKRRHFYRIYLPVLLLLLSVSIVTYAAETTDVFYIAVTTGVNDPIVYNVTAAQVTPSSGSHAANVAIRFNVTDADGVDDTNSGLNDSSAKVNLTLTPGTTNEYSRFNDTGNCEVITNRNVSIACLNLIKFFFINYLSNAAHKDFDSNIGFSYIL